jgi:hypothetical protein
MRQGKPSLADPRRVDVTNRVTRCSLLDGGVQIRRLASRVVCADQKEMSSSG